MHSDQNQEAMKRWMMFMAGEREYMISSYPVPFRHQAVSLDPPPKGEGQPWTFLEKEIINDHEVKVVLVTWCRPIIKK